MLLRQGFSPAAGFSNSSLFFRRNGGYSYSNAGTVSRPAGSSYYAPSASAAASGAGFFTAKGGASGGGYSYYQNASGARSYK